MSSTNALMANFLADTEARSEHAARANLMTLLESRGIASDAYTTPQLRAMVKLEQLKLVGDLELEAILLRGKVIQQIENEGLWSIHPNQYASMQEAAVANGLSLSEYHDIRNLYNIVFPYLTGTLGLNLPLVWEEVGKSNFRELTPVLVRLITGHASGSRHVEETSERLLDDIAAAYQAAGQEVAEEDIQREAVGQLIERGQLPNRELRQILRPDRTPSFPSYITEILHEGQPRKVVISVVDEDQLTVFRRRLGHYTDARTIPVRTLAQSALVRAIMEANL
jgi:hypothetical protein